MEDEKNEKKLRLMIDDSTIAVEWENNAAVDPLMALVKISPFIVQTSIYGGFEQVGSLGKSLPREYIQTTTQAGDIVLYSGNQIVIFYSPNS